MSTLQQQKKARKETDGEQHTGKKPTAKLDALAHPFDMHGLALFLGCLKFYPTQFPSRAIIIAAILNQTLSPAEQVSEVIVKNIISKLRSCKQSAVSGEKPILLSKISVEPAAEAVGARHVALPHVAKCLICDAGLFYTEAAKKPFFFPKDSSPGKGVIHEKHCKACGSIYLLSYYRPRGVDEHRPYPQKFDHSAWLKTSSETVISKGLLEKYDSEL